MLEHERVAVNAVISMLLEVSANPKPGNVDREHDFEDLKYEHFLISSASSFPAFLKIARKEIGIGEGIYSLVRESHEFHKSGNVHFGAFLLLTPLVYSSGDLKQAYKAVRNSTCMDSIFVKKAFDNAKVRVMDAEKFDLRDDVERKIREGKLNLYEWMKLAPKENFIAREYVDEFRLTNLSSDLLFEILEKEKSLGKALTILHVKLLSKLLDPLIIAKKGLKFAKKVKEMAKSYYELYEVTENFAVFEEFDRKLISMKANPGSVADLIISSIFISLCRGLKV